MFPLPKPVDPSPFDAVRTAASTRQLRVDTVLDGLDDGRRAELERVLNDLTYKDRHIVIGLREWGIVVADNSVTKWRKRYGLVD